MRVLPNTAGCHSVKEAVTTAQMAREIFETNWIKLEVIGNQDTLQPDVFGLVEAARILAADGFEVFPYTTEDLVVGEKLLDAGCRVLMPWGAPIGSGRGLNNLYGLRAMRAHFPDVPLVIDAGIGLPSQAAQAMELGYDAILLNTAVAKAGDPARMADGLRRAPSAPAGRPSSRSHAPRGTWPNPQPPCWAWPSDDSSIPSISSSITSAWLARLLPVRREARAAAHQGQIRSGAARADHGRAALSARPPWRAADRQ